MDKAIGIDLGTTNSVIAHEDHTGVEVVLNRAHERLTPSVVGVPRKSRPGDDRKPDISIGSPDLLIGSQAVDGAARNPEHTIFSIKRLVGRFYDDPNVAEMQRRYRYRIVKPQDGDDVRVMLGDKVLTPTEVSAMILRRLKDDAQARLGDEVTHAVITVPAYFSMNQRLATRTAGELAGLRVKTIIDEPTAAAMAFGVNLERGAMKNVLVYDLGGGTFDISILFITGEMFNQLAIEGDMWLGGDDFDYAIVQHVLKAIQQEYRVDASTDSRFMLLLKKAAEKAKIRLSEMQSADIVLEAAVPLPNGDRGDVDVELTRRQFEDLRITSGTIKVGGVPQEELRRWCEDLKINGSFTERGVEFDPDTVRNRIKKTILLTRKALREAGITREQIDHVLLVGGSTTLPLVQRMLEEEFGAARIMRNIDPMACVALGAGLAAQRIPGIVCQNAVGKDASGKDQGCLEPNDARATVCRKCGAPLVAQKSCPGCNYPNALEAERCANPAGCSYTFKRIEPSNVTAKPVGILAAGGAYEVIVPKGTPYPTNERVIKPFRTAENTQRAVRVPLYHAEVTEFDPDDVAQWLGAADINLEGAHLPAGTRVDVGIDIDRDGCLDVEAIIQDGSGRRQRVFIDPRLGSRRGSMGGGNEAAQDAEETVPPPWDTRLWWSVVGAEIALRDYEWLISDHRTTQTLQDLVKAGREALRVRDEAKGRPMEKEIDSTLENEGLRLKTRIDSTLENEFKEKMILLYAEMWCLVQNLEPALRAQMRSLLNEISDGLRARRSTGEIQRKMDELAALLRVAQSTSGAERRKDKGTYLER
ncbi:MAG: Hsp70 family protein [Chloroflexi bacterium]|nr:Hsp70 family protein [Chloroflexota bacterium]